ncbi:MAG: nitroreductase family protein [Anaerolineales bacterium]
MPAEAKLAGAFHKLAAARQSIRRFTDEPVPKELVERILRTACQAPSAHNRQPWRFVVLPKGQSRDRLAQSMAHKFRQDLMADGLPEERIEELVTRGYERLTEPPMAILLCRTMEDMDPYPDERRQAAERTMAIQSVALAGGQILLAAHAEGLGACWVCAPLFVPEIVRSELQLPDGWQAEGVIIMGWPAETGHDRGRKPLEEVTLWR